MLRKWAGWFNVSAEFLDDQWPGLPVHEQLEALGKKLHGDSFHAIGAIHVTEMPGMDYKASCVFWKDDGR